MLQTSSRYPSLKGSVVAGRCQGLYSATPSGKFVPGLEFSGTVVRLGKAVAEIDGWRPAIGAKVMGVTRFGGDQKEMLLTESGGEIESPYRLICIGSA
jgi:NADPH:quinone reductase-like Zn-dependent oxidoreductase